MRKSIVTFDPIQIRVKAFTLQHEVLFNPEMNCLLSATRSAAPNKPFVSQISHAQKDLGRKVQQAFPFSITKPE